MSLFYVLTTKCFQKRGHYSRGDIIQGRSLFKEIRYIESNFSTFTCIGANFCVQFSFHNKRVWKIWTYDTKHFSPFLLRNNWKNKFISNTQFKIHFTKNNIIDNYSSFQKKFIYDLLFIISHYKKVPDKNKVTPTNHLHPQLSKSIKIQQKLIIVPRFPSFKNQGV